MDRADAVKYRAVYYAGDECKEGHASPRYTAAKSCVTCDYLRKLNMPAEKLREQRKRSDDKRKGTRNAYYRESYKKNAYVRNPSRYIRPQYKKTHRNSTIKRRKSFNNADILRDCDETKKIIDDIYRRAQVLTAQTGVEYSVDHIVPINNAKVCGLHIPCNLQVITLEENLKKGNKFKQ